MHTYALHWLIDFLRSLGWSVLFTCTFFSSLLRWAALTKKLYFLGWCVTVGFGEISVAFSCFNYDMTAVELSFHLFPTINGS